MKLRSFFICCAAILGMYLATSPAAKAVSIIPTTSIYDFHFGGDQLTMNGQMVVENAANSKGGHIIDSASGTYSYGIFVGNVFLSTTSCCNSAPDNLLYLDSPYVDQFGIGFRDVSVVNFIVYADHVDPAHIELFDGRLLAPDDFGMLTISPAVPEPSTWAMMILGFAGIGFTAYRRKARPALLAA